MARDAYYTTIGELAAAGTIPSELIGNDHLVYSSPATLTYNSPGAQGFGVAVGTVEQDAAQSSGEDS